MSGRLLELPILIMLALVGIVWLASVSPALGLAAAAVAAATMIVFFARGWIEARGLRLQARRLLEQAAAEHGLELGMRQEGRVEIHGGLLGLDHARRKLAFASPKAALVADFDRVRRIDVGLARALGQSVPSWYSINLHVDGEQESLPVATRSRRRAKKWLDQLGRALGPERVKDARASLD